LEGIDHGLFQGTTQAILWWAE